MTRHDELSDRARWFLQNFDEIDLADLCASHEASNQKRQEDLDRIRDACKLHRQKLISNLELYAVIEAHTTPAPAAGNDGPSVKECADADRAHWTDKYAGEA